VEGLSLVLANGDSVTLRRGEHESSHRGLTIVTDQGNRIEIPTMRFQGPGVKNASGYYSSDGMDPVDLFIGAEGTLGVVTDVGIRLAPHAEWVSGLSFLPHRNEALDFARILRSEPGVMAIEYFDVTSLDLIQEHKAALSLKIPDFPEGMRVALYWEVSLESGETLEDEMQKLEEQLNRHGGSLDTTWSGYDPDQAARLRSFRHAVPEVVNHMIATAKSRFPEIRKISTDTALPRDVFEETFHEYIHLIESQGLSFVAFGHLGDHHIHFNLLPSNKIEYQSGLVLYDQMMDLAIQRGGSVSAEHGIGKIKTTHLAKMVGADALNQMKKVKPALDPDWLLNSGNLSARTDHQTVRVQIAPDVLVSQMGGMDVPDLEAGALPVSDVHDDMTDRIEEPLAARHLGMALISLAPVVLSVVPAPITSLDDLLVGRALAPSVHDVDELPELPLGVVGGCIQRHEGLLVDPEKLLAVGRLAGASADRHDPAVTNLPGIVCKGESRRSQVWVVLERECLHRRVDGRQDLCFSQELERESLGQTAGEVESTDVLDHELGSWNRLFLLRRSGHAPNPTQARNPGPDIAGLIPKRLRIRNQVTISNSRQSSQIQRKVEPDASRPFSVLIRKVPAVRVGLVGPIGKPNPPHVALVGEGEALLSRIQ
jgi:FAD/FMN-containing dehydrogenase